MGNNSSTKKREHQRTNRHHSSSRKVSATNGHESSPPSYRTSPESMTDSNWRSRGPTRPGLASYESPKNFPYSGPDVGSASSQMYGGSVHGLGVYIDRLTGIWSDMEPLNNIPESSLSEESHQALRKVFERLLDSHTYTNTLSKDHDHVSKQNRNLMEEKEVLTNNLRERESTIQQLQSSLKAFRDSPRTANISQSHRRHGSDDARKFPKTLAGGSDTLALREKVIELEEQLKQFKSDSSRESPEKELERLDDIQVQYGDLESIALHQIKPIVDHISKQLTDSDKLKLIYNVLEISLEKSQDLLESLKTTIRKLVHHPDRFHPIGAPSDEANGPGTLEHKPSLIVRENVKMFENRDAEIHRGLHKHKVSQEKVNMVFQRLRSLMREEANNCKLTNLETDVIEAMKVTYGSSIHASLWFDSKFTKFLTECCKLAWKIALMDRKIVLEITTFESFNEKRHLPYRCEILPKSRVDYFAWPVLIDSDSNFVLCRGRAHFS